MSISIEWVRIMYAVIRKDRSNDHLLNVRYELNWINVDTSNKILQSFDLLDLEYY